MSSFLDYIVYIDAIMHIPALQGANEIFVHIDMKVLIKLCRKGKDLDGIERLPK